MTIGAADTTDSGARTGGAGDATTGEDAVTRATGEVDSEGATVPDTSVPPRHARTPRKAPAPVTAIADTTATTFTAPDVHAAAGAAAVMSDATPACHRIVRFKRRRCASRSGSPPRPRSSSSFVSRLR